VVSAFLTEQMRDIEDRMVLGGALRGAARAGELQLHYQPQFAASPHRLTGFEALLRWTNPTLGVVSPGRFIPVAESLGLMPEIGVWVLREACRQARAWLDAGRSGFNIAVNVSAQQMQRPGLVQAVADAIAEHALPAHVLDIELTESSLMENVSRVQGTLAELKALGVMLSLDDFGTGYSSLAYLKHFPLDKLKIDQSFVRGLPGNADDAAIARTIVSIGHQLRMIVSAEGVETQEQADFLREIGCDELQGYFLGRPVPTATAEGFFP
jgi:EAL domain-containing protein (putative c-di-GMP-specific phosphodiesterase class I)